MLTHQEFLEVELDAGIGFHNQGFIDLCNKTVDEVMNKIVTPTYNIKTIMDYGAGTGVYTDAFMKRGYDVSYFDIWESHRKYAKQHIPNLKIVEYPVSTDLMLFIEVAEHMKNKEINALFKVIKPDYILFSSTSSKTDNDKEWGHINIKSQEDWQAMFLKLGYEKTHDLNYPTSWSKLFKRKLW